MEEQISRWLPGISVEFVEAHDQENLTPLEIHENFDQTLFNSRTGRSMDPGEMSLSLKFKKAFKKISTEESGELFLVLEDDIIFKEDPIAYIESLVPAIKKEEIDCVFLGEAAMRIGDNRNLFEKKEVSLWPLNPYGKPVTLLKEASITNGLCTVLYTKSAAHKIWLSLEHRKIGEPLDWDFNSRFRDLDLNVYWGKAITAHGSVLATHDDRFTGLKSALRDNY